MRRSESPWWTAGFTSQWWETLDPGQRASVLGGMSDMEAESFAKDWRVWGRDDQLGPPGRWRSWTIKCGRGWGKTRTAVEVVSDEVESGRKGRVCLLGQGEDDVRDVMIEGRSGFLQCAKSWFRPKWRPSRGGGMLEWPNGGLGYVYSAEDPEALRGPEFDLAWIDEIMAFKAEARQKAESNLRFGLRLPPNPQRIYTTTPKPHKWLKDHLKKINPEKGIYLTNGTTYDNRANLAEEFMESITDDYSGTRLGKQELGGEVLSDSDNALWSSEGLDEHRTMNGASEEQILAFSQTMERIVVAVDPNISATGRSHAAGITVIGMRAGVRFLLADRTSRKGPDGWAQDTIVAFDDYKANEVVAEVNQGGDLVKSVIEGAAREAGRDIAVVKVHATRGKQKRAEPVAAAYERGKISHVGPAERYATLETQMTELHEGLDTTGEDFDRVDSLVWGMTRLASAANTASSVGGGTIITFADYLGA